MAPLYERREGGRPAGRVAALARDIDAILALKRARNAFSSPITTKTHRDLPLRRRLVGDSLAMAREATRVDADVIVARWRALSCQTAKLLNPGKTVADPRHSRGSACVLDHRRPMCGCCAGATRVCRRHPYVNTSAAVKAESDICCTSGNARKTLIARGRSGDHATRRISGAECGADTREIIAWAGHCRSMSALRSEIRLIPRQHPGVGVLAHPECPLSRGRSDFAGSTAAMIEYVGTEKPGARRSW